MELIFWNINNNAQAVDLINSIDFTEQKRIVAIAEFWSLTGNLERLSSTQAVWHDEIHGRTGVIYSKNIHLTPYGGEKYFSVYKIQHKGMKMLLVVVNHLKSQHRSEFASAAINLNVIKNILDQLNSFKNERIIIMGDFNMTLCNDVISFYHLNATDYFSSKEKHYKTCDGEKRIKFYSPIQSFSGDMSKGPPGSYYYVTQTQSQAWHILDNALVSYPLVEYLDRERCEIMSNMGGTELLKNSRPNKQISDHLPVKIKLA
ncbi:MAG: hypothetical protein D3916_02590 [Candidatus Electrothrix sp. MAN1_4]|nr:hypothetical protein [Candidatus Electrothrix sp. MAN1_4]